MKPFLLLIFSLLLFFPFYSQATHIVGGEITYECIGNNQYKIKYVFYRDCGGMSADDSLVIHVENSCGMPFDSMYVYRQNNPLHIISPACPGYLNRCNGGLIVGHEKIYYEGLITLNGSCLWTLSYTGISRIAFITMSSELFYISASINTAASACDTSPVFTNDPMFFLCVGQTTCDNPGMFDAEGDSLVCERVDPLIAANTTFTYGPGYSFIDPMGSIPPISIDQNTGEICFTPQQSYLTPIATSVSSYRNGILLGQVKRDIAYWEIQCTNHTPQIGGINGSNSSDLSACVGETICFHIASSDPDQDSTFLTWSHNLGNASFIVDTMTEQTGEFCWTTTPADIDTTPHCFTVSVIDNNCRGVLTSLRSFCITIHDSDTTCIYLNQSQILNEKSVLIYPQPSSGEIHIDFREDFQNTFLIEIRNALGQTVFTSELKERNNVLFLNDGISPGVYFVNLFNQKIKAEIIRKMIVVD